MARRPPISCTSPAGSCGTSHWYWYAPPSWNCSSAATGSYGVSQVPSTVRGRNCLIEESHRLRYHCPRPANIAASAFLPSPLAIRASAASAAAYSRVADAGWSQSLSPPLSTHSLPRLSPDGM